MTIKAADIDTWDMGVSLGTDLKEDLDRTHLNLGILANHLCPVRRAGARSKDNRSQTITALAKAIGIGRSWLSNAAANAAFYAGYYDKVPPQANINELSKARKITEWKPNQDKKPTKTQIKLAMAFLDGQVDEPEKIPPTAISYVRAARAKLIRALEHEEPLESSEVTIVEKAKDGLDEIDSHYESEDD